MNQLLPFKVGAEVYALPLGEVQEVVDGWPIYPLPAAPQTVRGALGFHGRILPVLDLPQLLGLPAGERASRLIVLVAAQGPLVLSVDALLPIISLPDPPELLSQSRSAEDCIAGVFQWRQTMISLFDLEQLHRRIDKLCGKKEA